MEEDSQNGAAADGQVDTNNIPILLIDRIEVNNVGGASVYGADAVAGVINYILKDDFEGFRLQYDYNNVADISEDRGVKMLFGANFDDGKGNFALSVDYNETGHIMKNLMQRVNILEVVSMMYYNSWPGETFN